MKVLSLYSGAGGIDEGLKQAGIKTTLAIDFDSDCCKTMKLNHPDCEVICGNVGDYLSNFPKSDITVGGPPCLEFSRANSNRKFDMCEVNNFWSAVERVKPKYYLMENVQDIKKTLFDHNFLLDAADYGVPQNRLRRFFTNIQSPPPTHAEKPQNNLFDFTPQKWVSVKEALGIDGILQDRKTTFGEGFRNYSVDKPSFTLVADSRIFISKTGFSGCNQIEKTRSIDEPAPTVMAQEEMQFTDYKIYSLKHLKEKNEVYYNKHPANDIDKPNTTILGKDRGTEGYIHDNHYARKLTNEECAILQGFPKEYKFYGNKTSVRRQIGNAVPPPVIKAFFKTISMELIQ